jgi:hypothetical protein
VRGREARSVRGGKVTVPPNDVREILLVPKAGRYSAHAGSLLSRVLGMSSRIIVE